MKLAIVSLLLILQVAFVSANSGLSDECSSRPSIECHGETHTMSEEDCEKKYQYFYCAKEILKDDETGDWSLMNGTYSSHRPVVNTRCLHVSDLEIRVIFPEGSSDEIDVFRILKLCRENEEENKYKIPKQTNRYMPDSTESALGSKEDTKRTEKNFEDETRKVEDLSTSSPSLSKKSIQTIEYSEDSEEYYKRKFEIKHPSDSNSHESMETATRRVKFSPRHSETKEMAQVKVHSTTLPSIREESTASIEFAEMDRNIYLTEKNAAMTDKELKRQIDDLYSLTAQNRMNSIVIFIVFLFIILIVYRQSKKESIPLSFDQRPLVLDDYDVKTCKPSTKFSYSLLPICPFTFIAFVFFRSMTTEKLRSASFTKLCSISASTNSRITGKSDESPSQYSTVFTLVTYPRLLRMKFNGNHFDLSEYKSGEWSFIREIDELGRLSYFTNVSDDTCHFYTIAPEGLFRITFEDGNFHVTVSNRISEADSSWENVYTFDEKLFLTPIPEGKNCRAFTMIRESGEREDFVWPINADHFHRFSKHYLFFHNRQSGQATIEVMDLKKRDIDRLRFPLNVPIEQATKVLLNSQAFFDSLFLVTHSILTVVNARNKTVRSWQTDLQPGTKARVVAVQKDEEKSVIVNVVRIFITTRSRWTRFTRRVTLRVATLPMQEVLPEPLIKKEYKRIKNLFNTPRMSLSAPVAGESPLPLLRRGPSIIRALPSCITDLTTVVARRRRMRYEFIGKKEGNEMAVRVRIEQGLAQLKNINSLREKMMKNRFQRDVIWSQRRLDVQNEYITVMVIMEMVIIMENIMVMDIMEIMDMLMDIIRSMMLESMESTVNTIMEDTVVIIRERNTVMDMKMDTKMVIIMMDTMMRDIMEEIITVMVITMMDTTIIMITIMNLTTNITDIIRSKEPSSIRVFIITCYQTNSGMMDRINVSIDPSEALELRENCTYLSTISKMSILLESVGSWNVSLTSFHKKYSCHFLLKDGSIIRFSDRGISPLPNGSDIVISKLKFEVKDDPLMPETVGFHLQSKNLFDAFNESSLSFSIDNKHSENLSFDNISAWNRSENLNELDGKDGSSDVSVQSRLDNVKKEEKREKKIGEGNESWIKEHYFYFVIGSSILLILVIALTLTLCIICCRKRQNKMQQQAKMKKNALSLQRAPEEHPLIQESSPSTISDFKPDPDEGSKQEPSKELFARSEASKTGEVTETEQRLSRIKTAR
ncbi:hypothetical protein PRIPAC_74295 [Pristionchus pacificus]|uniref:Uncharacterized protein n=1 Tax=Pristionchus pacificus TaxID=54126 RepID=A0A2A6C9N5_PRIPA|nr:hypothetical protein PRIPAC_74295 [Pristionchus pacificus]|eukprot:PDM74925.1 hypothetical protein PRIPAC_40306 [Pristionchus pacificus]